MKHGTIDGEYSLSYIDVGQGEPILLIHGFASSKSANWVHPGWVHTLTEAGHRVIAFDNRGHGESGKPHHPEHYTMPHMVGDALKVLDHLGIQKAHVMGYSMGARIASHMALQAPERMNSAILGGLGIHLVTGMIDQQEIIEALESPSLELITHPRGYMFRNFAEKTGSDLKALAACMKAGRHNLTAHQLQYWQVPSLIVVGGRDLIAGSGHELAALIPGAQHFEIPNRDHMPAVGDKLYKAQVLEFLAKR